MSKTQVLGGRWRICGQAETFGGELHYNEEERFIALSLKLPADEGTPAPHFTDVGDIPFITGTLFSGAKVVLYRCQTGQRTEYIPSYSSMVVYADYAFWGLGVDNQNDLLFKGACVDFGDILNWYELCKYEHAFTEKGPSEEYVWNKEDPITLIINENLTISFEPSTSAIFGEIYDRKLSLEQTVWVRFDYKNDVPWEAVIKDIQCIEYLIGIGTTQKVEIDDLKFKHHSLFVDLPLQDGERYWEEAEVLLGTGKVSATQGRYKSDYLCTFKEFLAIEKGVENWVEKYEKLKPILDLYFNIYKGLDTPEMTFLSLMQALETFHSRFVTNSVKDYSKRVELLVAKYDNEEIKNKWKDYLIDEGQKAQKKSLYLRSRIADLVYANGELPIRCGFRGAIIPRSEVQQLCDTRNYYTHYDEKKKGIAYSAGELPTINGYLMCLLEYHLMILLGFNARRTEERISEIVRRINVNEQIVEASHKRYEKKNEQDANC